MARWQVVGELDATVWDAFVEAHPHSTIYHTRAMHEVFRRTPGHEPLLWAALDERGTPVALLTAVRITLRSGWTRALTTRVVSYGAFLAEESARGVDALAAVLEAHAQAAGEALFTELRHMHDPAPWRAALARAGYQWEPHLNFLIPLHEGEEAVWKRMKRSAREKVRQAQKRGVEAREVTCVDDVTLCYQLLQEVYTDVRVPLAPLDLFTAAYEVLVPQGKAKFWLAYYEGQPVGTRITLVHRDTLLDWYAGARRSVRRVRPNDFLVWHVLRWGIAQGYRVFDFGGAGHPDVPYGVRDFKAKFGGELVNYGRSTAVHHPWRLCLSRTAYALWRALRRPR